ncbi:caspase-like [Sitodiplosis mosellana]|uniref:caspase-like n=1 Tax=Sitodiplosis mosellana TaxID=263140 RepID=UPI00244536AD|nr:caspase-like [Sitodiplosis mosellana]XP_055318470.1 caspase-like [Sitodiplosis mosellana]XP_055318471.1 caspase-like [Sitodiplosis mosellana]
MGSPIEGTPIDGKAESKNDTTDALPGGMTRNHSNAARVARMPTDRYASEYNMRHNKRGMAIVFNHEHFDIPTLKSRTGTNVDCENLRHTLETLQFDVVVHKDLRLTDIHQKIENLANADHSEHDCLLISILSHGELGYIYAKDTHYKLENIWSFFTAPRCPTLAGKPKLFFIQACQGDRLDGGITLSRTETDSSDSQSMAYKIPIHADFLIAYSTIPGYYSWRNTTKGSWFMQCLCQELEQNGKKYDILTLLTFVCQRVAIDFESNTPDNPIMHQQKQIPCITTMLTRLLRFHEK